MYFDWSLRRGVFALFGEHGLDYRVYLHLNALLDDLKEPTRIVGETTFDSFNLDRRKAVIERARAEGHELLCVPTRQTTKSRYRAGFGDKDPDTLVSDSQDTQAIRWQVQHGGALKAPGAVPDDNYLKAYTAVKQELMRLRSTGIHSHNRNGNVKFVPDKDTLPALLEPLLPPVNDLADEFQKALGSTEIRSSGEHKGYNKTLLAAVAVLAKHCSSRKMLDQVSGMHTHAYGSQVRSDMMFWVWAGGGRRAKLYTGSDPDTMPSIYGSRRDGLTLTDYRRAVRWLYRQLKDLRDSGSANW